MIKIYFEKHLATKPFFGSFNFNIFEVSLFQSLAEGEKKDA